MLSRRLLRIKVIKALYAHLKSDSDSLTVSLKNLTTSVDKAYDLYHQMLWLIVEVKRHAEARIELAKEKKLPTKEDLNPNTKFVNNRVIEQIEQSEQLGHYLEQRGLGWANHPELIKNLYAELIQSDSYKEYMEEPKQTYKGDVRMVERFFLEIIEDNPEVEQVLEEQSILWVDDMDFALILTLKTVDASRKGQEDIPILPKYKSDEDREFYKELFTRAMVNYGEYLGYIERFTKNWEVERIAFMDNIIMVAAIAEIVNFDSIPIKVSLNEYIEISKYYSTQSSSNFINGVLDKVVETLESEGKVQKRGKGLL